MTTPKQWKRQTCSNLCTQMSTKQTHMARVVVHQRVRGRPDMQFVYTGMVGKEIGWFYPRCPINAHVTCSTGPVHDQFSHLRNIPSMRLEVSHPPSPPPPHPSPRPNCDAHRRPGLPYTCTTCVGGSARRHANTPDTPTLR